MVPFGITPVIPDGATVVQAKVVPAAALLKLTKADVEPEHIISLEGENVTPGDGFIVMVNVFGDPGHPSKLGITVMVATIGLVPLLTVVNAGIAPTPVAPNPILGLLLLQL